jgi:DNA-binding NtrC family response regulator
VQARILVIDDDEGMCCTLTRMAQEEGHEARSAHTLKAGLEKAHIEFYLPQMKKDYYSQSREDILQNIDKPSQKKDFGPRSRRRRILNWRHTQVFRGFKF